VLQALLAGRDAFNDTRLALDAILDSFRYGHGGILAKLLFGSHIDKVLFAATKADHVPDIQRDHLAALLRNMAAFPALEVRQGNAQLDVMALASVVCTAEDSQEIEGQRLQVVVGRPVGGAKRAKFFVGNVPIRPPRPHAPSVEELAAVAAAERDRPRGGPRRDGRGGGGRGGRDGRDGRGDRPRPRDRDRR